eukprot:Gb_33897 [translate_table: standard]
MVVGSDTAVLGEQGELKPNYPFSQDNSDKFGCAPFGEGLRGFYEVFNGHGGEHVAHFVHDNLPMLIVDDVDFPSEIEKVLNVIRALDDWLIEGMKANGVGVGVEGPLSAKPELKQCMFGMMLQEKKSASSRPSNVVVGKDRLRKIKNAKALMLAGMNKKTNTNNFKNAPKLNPVNDPFSQRWTCSQNYHNAKGGSIAPRDEMVVKKEVYATKASDAATVVEATIDAGNLVDTQVLVFKGTKLFSLHNFELSISLAKLQKFRGAKDAHLAFMARKQRIEATSKVQVPSNDRRRHSLTLTMNDYKQSRGLL